MALHDEQGILATSLRDVAARAGVAPATVLRHFPVMDGLIEACGRLADERYPLPTNAVLDGATDARDAVRRVAAAFFAWWGRDPTPWYHLQVDRRRLPPVDGWLDNVEAVRRGLLGRALGAQVESELVTVVCAMTSHGAWQVLREAGMRPEEAARSVARFIESEGRA